MNRTFFSLGFGLLLTACSCDDDVSIEIVEPEEGQTFNAGDDIDAARDGVQIIVLVATDGIDIGSSVTLTLNAEQIDGTVEEGGTARFAEGVTLEPGENTLQASADGKSSAAITVTLGEGDECPAVTISRPESGQVLRGADDEDREECGEFVYTVIASTAAQEGRGAELTVNGNNVGSAVVTGAELRFEAITLDSGPNDLEVTLDGPGDCAAEAAITVDCGVTCTIRAPTGDTLNGESDTSDDPGMQVDVEVETDAEDGSDVVIIIDDDEQFTEAASGGSATFADAALAEGDRSIQAICVDEAGNEARSARVRFLVDSVDPTVELTTNKVSYAASDDFDDVLAGLQIRLCGTSSEAGELCAAVDGGAAGPEGCAQVDADTEGCGVVTCSGATNLVLSATDGAGNSGSAPLAVQCDDGLPQLQIIDPANGAIFNASNDSVQGDTFQHDFVVCTSEIGQPVQLFRGQNEVGNPLIAVDEGPCNTPAYGDLPGRVVFEDVTIPEGESTYHAHTVDGVGNESDSPPDTFTVDSAAPNLTLTICNDVLGPPDDADGDPDNGIQVTFRGTTDQDEVTITVTAEGGGSQDYTDDADVFGALDYVSVTFEQGLNTITATLTDDSGNTNPFTCTVQANTGGFVQITSPVAGTDFTKATDGNTGVVNYQGGVVHVISDGPTDGTMQVCIDAIVEGVVVITRCVPYDDPDGVDVAMDLPEGTNQNSDVTLTARTVDHPRIEGGVVSSPPVLVQVDTQSPEIIGGSLTFTIIDVRAGIVDISFTAPGDVGGRNVGGYDVRDGLVAFIGENDGAIINDVPQGPIVAAGQTQTLRVSGLRPQTFHFMAVRATDRVGNAAPSLYGNVSLDMAVDVISSPTVAENHRFGYAVSGGQDVDDNGFDDFVVGTNDLAGPMHAYLFTGGADGATLATTFDGGGAFESFGFGVALLRDFNGDGLPDVAISNYFAGAAINGAVYIFFGGPGMPANLTPVDADVTINGAAGDFLGWRLSTAGDFNGDGLTDLVIGATPYPDSGDGKVYVVLGRNGAGPLVLNLPADRDLEIDSAIVDGGLGEAIGPAGDLNGDGNDDIIMGACRPGAAGGAAYVFLGEGNASIDADPVRLASEGTTLVGAGEGYGCSVGGIGDVNNDGDLDLVVGAKNRSPSNRGSVYIYPGNGLGGTLAALEIRNDAGPSPDEDDLGWAVATTLGLEGTAQPSLDSDGIADLAIGSYRRSDGPGRVSFYWGGVGLVGGDVVDAPAFVNEPFDGLSSTVAALAWVGDVDGDGFIDLVMGDEAASVGAVPTAGRVYLVR